ncbi:hypothetical protein AV530_010312 [Patagioenas fasciata monilis]|uniref:Uncharacterized protein n=1 Tax=Patagioenas fasciata monilis TaxID=372326 RepID=A0A1V4KEH5_PATFA|nr:hypothetical protein AV530_010312 [Patagioenas fasciata monilis]
MVHFLRSTAANLLGFNRPSASRGGGGSSTGGERPVGPRVGGAESSACGCGALGTHCQLLTLRVSVRKGVYPPWGSPHISEAARGRPPNLQDEHFCVALD